jgi:murein DD-endopeptidase MepM/ murein hydrolase activator NlpD
MRATRYTILVANRKTGAVRRLTLSRRLAVIAGMSLFILPLLIGAGSGGASQAEVELLRSANETLRLENDSYREATGELTEQISSLQTALAQLGEQIELDPATRQAIEQLARTRATGGASNPAVAAAAAASKTVPEGTFGILRDLLGSLESRLASVRTQVENQQQFGRATPSTWPIVGWLTSGFGNRKDPFTGQPDFHTGLDISAQYGTPIRATADGLVESAGYSGNYGNAVVVSHGYGISTRFGHLSRFASRPGQKIKRGEVIGYVGATGRATSSHLHYEILMNGQPINPLRLLTR